MSSTLAPIVFFAYKRPEHTRRSLESLSRNVGAEDSELFIYCDGIKHEKDRESVDLVRQVVRSKQWCGKVHIIEREKNFGLANSVISGVTEICDRYGKIIVLEDDLILSPYFLDYMNTALDVYENEPKVIQISGYMFPVDLGKYNTDTIFLPFTTSWGWGTWQRAWQVFDSEALGYKLLINNHKLRYNFDLHNSYPYFKMLQEQKKGKIDSWAIRWYLSTFIIDGITLYPFQTLVRNIGFDGSGTNCKNNLQLDIYVYCKKINLASIPLQIDARFCNSIYRYLRRCSQRQSCFNILNRLIKPLKLLLCK